MAKKFDFIFKNKYKMTKLSKVYRPFKYLIVNPVKSPKNKLLESQNILTIQKIINTKKVNNG